MQTTGLWIYSALSRTESNQMDPTKHCTQDNHPRLDVGIGRPDIYFGDLHNLGPSHSSWKAFLLRKNVFLKSEW